MECDGMTWKRKKCVRNRNTLAASSVTWPASEAKAVSKEVRRSLSSSWGREGAVGGAEEVGWGTRPRKARAEAPPSPGSGLANIDKSFGRSPVGSRHCSSHCSTWTVKVVKMEVRW